MVNKLEKTLFVFLCRTMAERNISTHGMDAVTDDKLSLDFVNNTTDSVSSFQRNWTSIATELSDPIFLLIFITLGLPIVYLCYCLLKVANYEENNNVEIGPSNVSALSVNTRRYRHARDSTMAPEGEDILQTLDILNIS